MTGTIIKWGWREQPDWDAINAALGTIDEPHIFLVDTGTSDFAIVVADVCWIEKDAQSWFDEHGNK